MDPSSQTGSGLILYRLIKYSSCMYVWCKFYSRFLRICGHVFSSFWMLYIVDYWLLIELKYFHSLTKKRKEKRNLNFKKLYRFILHIDQRVIYHRYNLFIFISLRFSQSCMAKVASKLGSWLWLEFVNIPFAY